MTLQSIKLDDCRKLGVGVQRPEDVVVARDGTVWISDQQSACARLLPDGSLQGVGHAGGAPNGINLDLEGRILIANFGGPEHGFGPLQRLDPRSGEVSILCSELNGRKLFACNYPLLDRQGRAWCSHSTWGPVEAAFDGQNDGLIFRVELDGRTTLVAEGLIFANGMAFDFDEKNLYVCQTAACDVVRLPIHDDGSLGKPIRYGPKLGISHRDVQDRRPLTSELRSTLGVTDGCGFDQEGNLWVTLVMANKIVAITPQGDVVTVLSDPEGKTLRGPTNVSWGGPDMRDLYIGSVDANYVLHARSPVPGMPLAHQR
jgi:gluconolactonase